MKPTFLLLLLTGFLTAHAQTRHHQLTVDVTNFKTDKGKAYIALQTPDQKPVQRTAVDIRKGTARVVFRDVTPGQYAVRLYHDTNGNQEFDRGMFGIPKESWGCSNNVPATMGPPRFEDMLFVVNGDKKILITMN